MKLFGSPKLPEVIEVAGRQLPVEVNRRRGIRRIKLRADGATGVVRLSLPPRGGVAEALKLIADNRDWLADEVARWPRPLPFAPGAAIPFDGATLTIAWSPDAPRTPRRDGDRLVLGGPPALLAGRVTRWLKAEALADLTPATHEIAARIERRVAAVRVGDTRSRWGSCAGGRNPDGGRIAYSWRLILAPAWVRRCVVAHEVAHLVHGHHGPDFHALLGQLDPNDGAATRWLRANGRALHWVGRD